MKIQFGKIGWFGGVVGVLILTIVLFWAYGSTIGKRSQILEILRQLKQEESAFNEAVLKLRFGFLNYYDSLSTHLDQMGKLFLKIENDSLALSEIKHGPLNKELSSYRASLKQRQELKDEFITENATFNNSFRYFPVLLVQLSDQFKKDGAGTLAAYADNLLRDILLHHATGNAELEPVITSQIAALQKDGIATFPEMKGKLNIVAQHAMILLQGRNELEGMMTKLMALPSATMLDKLSYQIYDHESKKNLQRNRLIGLGLNGVCLGVVGYMFFLFIRLGRTKTEIEKANNSLTVEIEERKRLEKVVAQSEKMAAVGQLAAGVAHEINNPVGFISNNMEVLQEYVGNYAKILNVIEKVKTKIDEGDVLQAKATIKELRELEEEVNLDFMKSDVNKLLDHSGRGLERVRKIVLDLRTFAREDNVETKDIMKIEEIIDSILSIVQSELKYKAELIKDYGDTPLFHCNPQRLGQVFINLLVNASQAIEVKGKITIKTYKQDQYVCIDITDTGKGIPEENLKKIFDPFFTTKPVGQGTGLGLSVSYEIIKKHGGEIKARSKVGEGTTFTVTLPIEEAKT